MSKSYDALERFRISTSAGPAGIPFRLASSISEPAAPGEIATAWRERSVPAELTDLWSATRAARLFEDVDYGQWGLILLHPLASRQRTEAERAERPQDVRDDDIVVGEFLGDQDLLVYAPSEVGLRRVLIAQPLDARTDWFGVASGLAQFLDSYFDACGHKYWETRNG